MDDAASPLRSRLAGWPASLVFALSVVAFAFTLAYGAHWGWVAAAALTAAAALVVMNSAKRAALADEDAGPTRPERAQLDFSMRQGVWALAFTATLVFAMTAGADIASPLIRIVLALTPAVLCVLSAADFVWTLTRIDELQRRRAVTATAISAGALVVAAGAVSLASLLLGAPFDIAGWTLLPAFSVLFAVVMAATAEPGA